MKRIKWFFKWLFGGKVDPKIFGVEGVDRDIVIHIVRETGRQWKIAFGKDVSHILDGVEVDIKSEPITVSVEPVYGYQHPTGIVVYRHTESLAQTAIVHELIHFILDQTTGDPDKDHLGMAWAEGFESPVKRILSK